VTTHPDAPAPSAATGSPGARQAFLLLLCSRADGGGRDPHRPSLLQVRCWAGWPGTASRSV
jgi:hypothetical protein